MDKKTQNIKKFAFQLSKKVNEYLALTTSDKPPLRATDLKDELKIKQLLDKHGFTSIYDGLKAIVKNELTDFIPELTFEKKEVYGKIKHNWFFSPKLTGEFRAKPHRPTKLKAELHLPSSLSLYFSKVELELLQKHKIAFEELINGDRLPKTELQRKFKQVGMDLCSLAKDKQAPKEYFEKLIAKQLIYQRFIQDKK